MEARLAESEADADLVRKCNDSLMDRINQLQIEAKGGDIMAAKDAERIAELEATAAQQASDFLREIDIVRELKAENKRLRPDAERYLQIIRLLEMDYEDVVYLAEHLAPEGSDDRIDSLIEFDAAMEGN